jgi:hypothetical protein
MSCGRGASTGERATGTPSLIVSAGAGSDDEVTARNERATTAGRSEASPSGNSGKPALELVVREATRASPSTTPTAANAVTSLSSRSPIGRRIALVEPTIVRGGGAEIAIGAGGSEDHSLPGRDDANAGAAASSDDA